jgi:hypothetical protein
MADLRHIEDRGPHAAHLHHIHRTWEDQLAHFLPYEEQLDQTVRWRDYEREKKRIRPPRPFVEEEPGWDDEERWGEWRLRKQMHERGVENFGDWYDRNDRNTTLGHIFRTHQQSGLDVVLHIDEITFTRENFGTPEEVASDRWPHNIFTEIRIIPGPKFIDLNLNPHYQTPHHYHITLADTYEVGRGYNWDEEEIQTWIAAYNAIRGRYSGRRARLGLDRWGNGHTFYINNQTVVEGLERPYNIFNDPDVDRVFRVPGKRKPHDGLHVSLLLDDH